MHSARGEVAARGLTPAAITHLTRDALGTIDLAALAPVKRLLKRYFSDEPWTVAEDNALAALVGAGDGWWRYELDEDIGLEFGWRDDAFRLEVSTRGQPAETFAGPVVPEATPNPRTIRFVTPTVHDGPSRWYESAVGVDDPRVAWLFARFDEVANVLVGPGFVAVGLHRPDQWERLLDPVLRAITADFASTGDGAEPGGGDDADASSESSRTPTKAGNERGRALERAWKELGSLIRGEPAALRQIVAAASSPNSAERQVAARLLADADADIAEQQWGRLLDDSSRAVRRATVDAMVDVERPGLRALLERALGDVDAWTRWKSLRGLVDLGVGPSRAAVMPLTEDPDFRVRLEATGALRALEDDG